MITFIVPSPVLGIDITLFRFLFPSTLWVLSFPFGQKVNQTQVDYDRLA